MKKALFLSLAAIAAFTFSSCSKNDDKGKLDPNAMISLRPAPGVKAEPANPNHLTARQIVEQATDICFRNEDITQNTLVRGFSSGQRDLVNVRLLMFGTDIIDQDGEYEPGFIEGEDIILIKVRESIMADTIAYIPNKVLRAAQTVIKAAYDRGDYTTCYDAFNTAFTFQPITGAEWKALKAAGTN